MANNTELAQIDYAFNNYYGRYIAPIVEKEYSALVKKQSKEYLDAVTPKNIWGVISAGHLESEVVAGREVLKNGKWNSQSISTVVDNSLKKIGNNKTLYTDWQILAYQWNTALYNKLGKVKYEELQKKCNGIPPGIFYMNERLANLMCDQVGRKGAPKTAAGRVIKKGIENSLFGFAHDITNRLMTPGSRKVSAFEQRVEAYNKRAGDPKSRKERWASYGTSALIDLATGGPVSAKSAGVNFLIGAGIIGGMEHYNRGGQSITYDKGSQYVMNYAYGSSDAADKAWAASNKKYRTQGSLLLLQTNTMLHKKVKVGSLGFDDRANQVSNKVLSNNRNSKNFLRTVAKTFDHQAIHYNSNAKVPGWMTAMSERQCRGLGGKFYAIAMEMSRSRKEVVVVGRKKMTLNEVAQRAFDYSHAAAIKRQHFEDNIAKIAQRRAAYAVQRAPSGSVHHHTFNHAPSTAATPREDARALYGQSASTAQPNMRDGQQTPQYGAQAQQVQQSMGYQPPSMGGWDNAMKQMGLSDFGATWQNIGYVLAMLPDMLIGMFTGKNQNFKLENNYMPLAAIIAGMFFTKNSFLKMLLLGLGGANLLNNANHAMKHDGQSSTPVRQLKSYPDEPLNSRIKNPVIKGRSLLGTFDGKPLCITINSNETIYAYEKGALPLNTLVNAILADMDRQQASASASYDRGIAEAGEQQRTVGIK